MLPPSPQRRSSWAREHVEQAVYLDLHGGTSYAQALALPLSFARAYFDSSAHQQHLKTREIQQKNDLAVIGRLDTVIKAVGSLGRVLARR